MSKNKKTKYATLSLPDGKNYKLPIDTANSDDKKGYATSNDDLVGEVGKKILIQNKNGIICYDPFNWVETEGGNSTPKIMFSKITPDEVTIKGETSKGGTIVAREGLLDSLKQKFGKNIKNNSILNEESILDEE